MITREVTKLHCMHSSVYVFVCVYVCVGKLLTQLCAHASGIYSLKRGAITLGTHKQNEPKSIKQRNDPTTILNSKLNISIHSCSFQAILDTAKNRLFHFLHTHRRIKKIPLDESLRIF